MCFSVEMLVDYLWAVCVYTIGQIFSWSIMALSIYWGPICVARNQVYRIFILNSCIVFNGKMLTDRHTHKKYFIVGGLNLYIFKCVRLKLYFKCND